jgi:hypothetical protein
MKIMQTHIKTGLLIGLLALSVSCKKFLEVRPVDTLSGSEFWQNQDDALKGINGAYRLLLDKFLESTLYNTGDFRAGWWNWFNKRNLAALGRNDLLSGDLGSSDGSDRPKNWTQFYKAIAAANLCIDRIPGIPDPAFSQQNRKALVAEARFIRAFTYFYMVRLYGDVPLQLDPYETDIKPRTDMLAVLDTCIQDLGSCQQDLPISYDDPTNRAVRATRGAALTLMAHMYMWKAGFDAAHKQQYWQQAADLGKQVMDLGVYQLLPYDKETFQTIFKGRSLEGIFELSLDINYGVQFHSLIAQWVLHEPVIHSSGSLYGGFGSEITPKREFLDKIYPAGESDKRFDLWFDDPYSNANPQSAMYLKFSSVSNPTTRDYDANFIMFRYAGLILLRAEALANLGQNAEAITLLNMIRTRAGARNYSGSGGPALQDAIFLERAKELWGEGHFYYDLVRTGRVMDRNQCEDYLTPEQFQRRGWTWPIDLSAVKNNPLIIQNEFWSR